MRSASKRKVSQMQCFFYLVGSVFALHSPDLVSLKVESHYLVV
jgi:hypothetical protein